MRPTEVRLIIARVGAWYHIPPYKLTAPDRTAHLANARHVAMYLVRKLSGMSYFHVGQHFFRDHSSVIHACQKVRGQMLDDPAFAAEMACIEAFVKTPEPEPDRIPYPGVPIEVA